MANLAKPFRVRPLPVSILLLLEMPQWLLLHCPCLPRLGRFNPSFTGNAAMASPLFVRARFPEWVSILLLLEMPQWPIAHSFHRKPTKRFNPSFTGNAAMAADAEALAIWVAQFQSFFYWKCRNGRLPMWRGHWCIICFNPSFTGNAAMASASNSMLRVSMVVSILLLLEMPQWHAVRFPQMRIPVRFNPSFTGNAAMAFAPPTDLDFSGSFNPSFTGNAAMANIVQM